MVYVMLKCDFSRAELRGHGQTSLGWMSIKSIVRVLSAVDSHRSDVLVPNQISSAFEAFSCNQQGAHYLTAHQFRTSGLRRLSLCWKRQCTTACHQQTDGDWLHVEQ